MSSTPLTILAVFLAVFITDVAWAIYINKVKDAKPLPSSLWATFLFGTGAIGTIGYTKDPWLLIPALLGAFAGTCAGVLWNRRTP